MEIISFKNREIDKNKSLEVYRCLNRKGFWFSVRQNNLVIGHTNNIVIKNCIFIINKAGKQRCIDTNQRNVHAFIKGYAVKEEGNERGLYELKYYPYDNRGFYTSLGEITKAKTVCIKNNKILCQP